MIESDIIKLGNILGLKNPKKVSDGIMWSCPFAHLKNKAGEFYHRKGTDRNPSFGISIGSPSVYNCFSCGNHSFLSSLPSNLSFITNKDFSEARDFIIKHDNMDFEEYDSVEVKPQILPAINEDVLDRLQDVPKEVENSLRLDKKTIDYFGLKYYNKDQRLVIPVRDRFNRLVALKGRYVGSNKKILENFKFIFYKGKDVKQSGVWLNMNRPLIEGKGLCVTESETDMWQLYKTGLVSNIWCSMGSKITSNQIFNLQQVSCPVILGLDDDEAGIATTNKLIKELKDLTPRYKINNYYGENDIADLVKHNKIKRALKSIGRV